MELHHFRYHQAMPIYLRIKKFQVSCISPTSYNSHEMTQMSVEWNCIAHRSMTHMSNTQDVKNNNTHNAQDHNISCNLTKTILQTKQSRWFSGGREVSNAWNQVSHTCALDRSANASSASSSRVFLQNQNLTSWQWS